MCTFLNSSITKGRRKKNWHVPGLHAWLTLRLKKIIEIGLVYEQLAIYGAPLKALLLLIYKDIYIYIYIYPQELAGKPARRAGFQLVYINKNRALKVAPHLIANCS